VALNLKKPQTIIITAVVAIVLILASVGAWWYFGLSKADVKPEQTSQSLAANQMLDEVEKTSSTARTATEVKSLSYQNIPTLDAYNQNPKSITDFNIVGSCSPENVVNLVDDSKCFVTDSALNPIIDFSNSIAGDTVITLKKGGKNMNGSYLILTESAEFTDKYTVFNFNFETGLKLILKFVSPTDQSSSLGFGEADFDCLNSKIGIQAKACFKTETDFQEYLKIYNQDRLKIKNDLEALKQYQGDSN